MGNKCCSQNCEITFLNEKENNKNNIIIIKNQNNKEEEKKTIFEGLDNEKDWKNFLEILNIIYAHIGDLSDDNKIIIKRQIKTNLSKIYKEEKDINIYLDNIDKFYKNSDDLNEIIKCIEIFKKIYSEKSKIGFDKIKCLIESIGDILYNFKNDGNKLFNEEKIEFFKTFLQDIFIINRNKDLIDEDEKEEKKEAKKKIITKIVVKKTIKKVGKKNNLHAIEETDNTDKIQRNIEAFKNSLDNKKEKNSSNFEKYSESSKNQIQKLEKKIMVYEEIFKICGIEEQLKNLIFYDETRKKEYPIKVINKKMKFGNILNLLYLKYPQIEKEKINEFTVDGKQVDLESETDYDNNTRIGFWRKQ